MKLVITKVAHEMLRSASSDMGMRVDPALSRQISEDYVEIEIGKALLPGLLAVDLDVSEAIIKLVQRWDVETRQKGACYDPHPFRLALGHSQA